MYINTRALVLHVLARIAYVAFIIGALAFAMCGCSNAWGRDDVSLRAVGERDSRRLETMGTWADAVEAAANVWNDTCGRTIYTVSPDGEHGIVLVPSVAWQWPDAAAFTDGDQIKMRDAWNPFDEHRTLLHELGHTMGFDHVYDRASIMSPSLKVDAITPEDIARMCE